MTATRFEPGKVYRQSFVGDSALYCYFRIDRRTAKSVWITQLYSNGREEVKGRKAVALSYDGREETFKPFGTYSMCMVVGADKLTDLRP